MIYTSTFYATDVGKRIVCKDMPVPKMDLPDGFSFEKC
jgi:hypothetical protein